MASWGSRVLTPDLDILEFDCVVFRFRARFRSGIFWKASLHVFGVFWLTLDSGFGSKPLQLLSMMAARAWHAMSEI